MATREEWLQAYNDSAPDRQARIAAAYKERTGEDIAQQAAPQQDSFGENVMDVAGEFASAANRSVMQGIDFLGPGTANAALRLMGSETQLPTFEGAYGQTPGAQGGFMEAGTPRNLVRGAGGAAPAAAGMAPVAGRNIATPAGALAELVGLGAAKPGPQAAGRLAFTPQGAQSVEPGREIVTAGPRELVGLPAQGKQAEATSRLIEEGSGSVRRFGQRINPYTGLVEPEEAAVEAGRQRVPEGIVSTVQAADPATKSRLNRMLDIVDQSKDDAKFSITNRPLDVAGESLGQRYDVINNVNRDAATQLDEVAQGLRGSSVDASQAFSGFMDDIDSMGVSISRGEDGALSAATRGSDISGIDAPTRAINRLLERIDEVETWDAYELHRLKRYIDENVSYGKAGEGLTGRTEGVIKKLRSGIDSALDTNFPEYDRVNTRYSETRGLLDELNRLVSSGSGDESVNFEKGLGTLLRRVLSNARSREPMLDLVSSMDSMAKKYSGPGKGIVPYEGRPQGRLAPAAPELEDDILTQVLFADELDRTFGTNARTSLQGDVGKVIDRGVDVAAGGTLYGALADVAKAGIDKARGINEEGAMKAMRRLVD